MNVNTREELFNRLCLIVTDEVARNELYIILDQYDITRRETSIALLQEDRNNYLLKQFIIAKTVKGCSKRTLEHYTKTLNTVLFQIGKNVDEISTADLRLYMAKRLYQDKVSKTTTKNEMRVVSSFFSYLHAEGIITENPITRIEAIKLDKKKKKAFTDLELEKMRSALRSNHKKAIFETLLSTGCRISELVNIRLEEINKTEIIVHGKGGKERRVYLNARAQWAIQQYLNEREDANPYLFPGINPSVCGRRRGTYNWYTNAEIVDEVRHTDMCSVEQALRRIGREVGVKAYPHKFRRTFATNALNRGMPLTQVSKLLGHESISTTEIYLDLNENEAKEAHQKYVI